MSSRCKRGCRMGGHARVSPGTLMLSAMINGRVRKEYVIYPSTISQDLRSGLMRLLFRVLM